MMKNRHGHVVLAGAGSGDPELITLKALKVLQTADVILTDRLVSPLLIEKYADEDAEVIYVGKQCSRGIYTSQQEINELMVEFALLGKLVLRLKGGDTSLFSNILDELQTLKAHDISYEIIPGVSAALGAAAYTGIPLTARGHSRGVRFLTLYDLENIKEAQWSDWANTDDTLVFYMSGQQADILAQNLLDRGISADKSLAVIQQATTPSQKTKVFSFENLHPYELPDFEHVPTLIMVGKVVNLHHEYKWIEESTSTESYFDNHKTLLQYAI